MISREKINHILSDIRQIKVGVYGDFCLDVYWIMDPAGSEVSVETGKQAKAVRKHYCSPGGASNLVANLAALKPKSIKAIGTVGKDIYGHELTQQLIDLGINIEALFVQENHFDTYAFVKKYKNNDEISRTDFGVFNQRSADIEKLILQHMEQSLSEDDVFIFNQQVPGSLPNDPFIKKVNALFKKHSETPVFLDSRHYSSEFTHVIRKVNEAEIARLNGAGYDPHDFISIRKVKEFAEHVFMKEDKPLFVTCGDRGIYVQDRLGARMVPGIQFLKQLDTVGAGDTALSALALTYSCGYSAQEAAWFANLAASVTVQKHFTTGTATKNEILEISEDPDLILNVEKAEHISESSFIPGTRIEIISQPFTERLPHIKHAVFDHDGTISTLRNGWEEVMEKMMFGAIVGIQEENPDNPLHQSIMIRLKDYIKKSTGIQTIEQMQELVSLASYYDLIPENERKDAYDYKEIFLKKLGEKIVVNLEKVRSNEKYRADYLIPGVYDFMVFLKNRKTNLYLLSGTDHDKVLEEAKLMGYYDLFSGNVFGAVDHDNKHAKKVIIEKIINDFGLDGKELLVIGDGPVEIRQAFKKGAYSIGVASNESEKGKINYEKRTRLIHAGADLIIPDFTDLNNILKKGNG